ncbi:hypothetical protein [Nonomuraea sp. NEAU-A123]|uniref:hypothetical protein n=1 Tax=Nonomuraea sp. NEAU-A123 TaxID=2839649 RepID=UPI001BE47B48|nr:hypothetical protein [Nonomuraea sp. NEAU-A123]MBT2226253.1 hypothetical protein [Nonomuraea sp. NEAU-A123]
MALIEAGLKNGNIRGSVAMAFEELLDQARRGAPLKNGALPYRCWLLVDEQGDELPNSAHFGLELHGHKIRATYRPAELRDSIRVVQREHACSVLVCACCSLPYDATEQTNEYASEDGPDPGGCLHFPTAEAAAEAGRAAGWVALDGLTSLGPRCARCADSGCECAGRRDYVDMMIGAKKLIKHHLAPELLKLRDLERQIRKLVDQVGEATAESDIPLGVDHRDAEEDLDRIAAAYRSLTRITIAYDDELARELSRHTDMPYGRVRDSEFSDEPPF